MPVLKPFSYLKCSFIIIFIAFLGISTAHAVTLKSLAQKSALLLAVADSEVLQKKCNLSSVDISGLSQTLKADVDAKIQSLTEKDFKILDNRTSTCQNDCTCSIYALAYEARNKENAKMKELAVSLTQKDRLKCTEKYKNICSLFKN